MRDDVVIPGREAWDRVRDSVKWVDQHRLAHDVRSPTIGEPAEAVFVRVTGAQSSGTYPGRVTRYDASSGSWRDGDSDVRILEANGEELEQGDRYIARPAGVNGAGKVVYVCVRAPPDEWSGSGCTITVVLDVCLGNASSPSGSGCPRQQLVVVYGDVDFRSCRVTGVRCELDTDGCCEGAIHDTPCCPGVEIPDSLTVTAPCLPVEGIAIDYDSSEDEWAGSYDLGDGNILTFRLVCAGDPDLGETSEWVLTIHCNNGQTIQPLNLSASCEPLSIVAEDIGMGLLSCGSCTDAGTIAVV